MFDKESHCRVLCSIYKSVGQPVIGLECMSNFCNFSSSLLLQPGASKHDRDDFLSEAAIIGQFSDPNVITLEGVVLKGKNCTFPTRHFSDGL